jgi:uncharacterized membrane protein
MVGAYAVPFLLGDRTGNIVVLFTYMSIINLGIMVLAFKKYWKPIFYFSFVLSWFIFSSWYFESYKDLEHFYPVFVFLTIFYLTFYVTYLSYNLIRKEQFEIQDVLFIVVNSFVFYGIGYAMLMHHAGGTEYLGLFTLVVALIQAVVCGIIYKMKLAEWHLFYFISALALTFLTIAVPVQLKGNWITLLWVGEAAILFWIGRKKQISVYEQLSFVLMIMAAFSIMGDWHNGYNSNIILNSHLLKLPIANIYFLTSLLFVAAFSFINILNRDKNYPTTLNKNGILYPIMQVILPLILIAATYMMFWMEIGLYFTQSIEAIGGVINGGVSDNLNQNYYNDLNQLKIVWLINYSLLFGAGLSMLNITLLKNKVLGYINLEFNLLVLIVFLAQGLLSLSNLRDSYLNQVTADFYHPGVFNFLFRYVSYLFVMPMLLICRRYVHQDFIDLKLDKAYDLILHTVILWILSSELITWIDFFKGEQSYKLGLSLLWGAYALLLIVLGIWKKHQHLRIGAIVLFGATLLKLFFYDMQEMNTIGRTIVFVTLGILLLIISFLYNKYKHIMWNESE